MKPDLQPEEQIPSMFENHYTVTPLSKYLAMTLFVLLPFVGGWIGYCFAPEKTVTQEIKEENIDDLKLSQGDEAEFADSQKTLNVVNQQKESELTSLIKAEYDEDQWENASDRVKNVLQDIRYDWLEEISFFTFSVQGVSGEVIHYCDKGDIVFERNGSPLCLGKNFIMISWNGNVVLVAEEDTPTQDSLFRLYEIFFNEGKFEKMTQSVAEEAALLIVVDELACIDEYENICFSDFSLSYVVTMPNLRVNQINNITPMSDSRSFISRWPFAESFYWNQSGTKAIYETPCPAGCPDTILEGFDFNALTIMPLVSRVDGYYNGRFAGRPTQKDIEWISDNEVRVGTSTLSF